MNITIQDWQTLGAGRYRFFGDYPQRGFYADARLDYAEGWHASIEGINFIGDTTSLADVIASYAETM